MITLRRVLLLGISLRRILLLRVSLRRSTWISWGYLESLRRYLLLRITSWISSTWVRLLLWVSTWHLLRISWLLWLHVWLALGIARRSLLVRISSRVSLRNLGSSHLRRHLLAIAISGLLWHHVSTWGELLRHSTVGHLGHNNWSCSTSWLLRASISNVFGLQHDLPDRMTVLLSECKVLSDSSIDAQSRGLDGRLTD